MEPRFKKEMEGECPGGNRTCGKCMPANIIPPEALLSPKDTCNNCDGAACLPFKEAGITCMGIEGLPAATEDLCKEERDGNFCPVQGISCGGKE